MMHGCGVRWSARPRRNGFVQRLIVVLNELMLNVIVEDRNFRSASAHDFGHGVSPAGQ